MQIVDWRYVALGVAGVAGYAAGWWWHFHHPFRWQAPVLIVVSVLAMVAGAKRWRRPG